MLKMDDDDTHLCLRCNTTIIGLDNYVDHKKKPGLCHANRTTTQNGDLLVSHSSVPASSSHYSACSEAKKSTNTDESALLSSCSSMYPLPSSYQLSATTSQTLPTTGKSTSENPLSHCSPNYPTSPSTFSLSPGNQILSSCEKSAPNDALLTTCSPNYSFGLSPVARSLSSVADKSSNDALLVTCASYPSPSFGLATDAQNLSTDSKTTNDDLLATCSSYPSPSFGLSPSNQPLVMTSDGKQSNDALLTTCSPNYSSPSCYDIYSRAYDFFSSLELQCKIKVTETPVSRDDQGPKDAPSLDTLYISPGILEQEAGVSYLGSDSESGDSYYPPRFHTGGKWKPGCRPDTLPAENQVSLPFKTTPESQANNQFSVIDNAIRQDVFGTSFSQFTKSAHIPKRKKKVWPVRHSRKRSPYGKINIAEKDCRIDTDFTPFSIVTRKHVKNINEEQNLLSKQSSKELQCSYCANQFCNKLSLAQHMFSIHWVQLECENHLKELTLHEDLLLKILPFQCLICAYYCNDAETLLSHVRNKQHRQKTAQLKNPLMCTACDYECRGCDDMIVHMTSKKHKKNESHVAMFHPVVIATSRMNCEYCTDKCQLQSPRQQKQLPKTKATVKSNEKAADITEQKYEDNMDKDADSVTAHSSEVLIGCHLCSATFVDQEQLSLHLKDRHNEYDLLECIINETVVTILNNEQNQVVQNEINAEYDKNNHDSNTETNLSSIKCTIDSSATNNPVHNEISSFNDEQLLISNETSKCLQNYETEDSKLSGSSPESSDSIKQPFTCDTCQKTFCRKSVLTEHMKKHLGVKEFKCDKCEFTTLRKFSLSRHKIMHASDRSKPFSCTSCSYSAHNVWTLKLHAKIHSQTSLPYKCDFEGCTLSFRSKSELAYHEHVHTNKRPFRCDLCNYAGKSAHQLTQHKRSHTGERPFKCKSCNYSAALSSQLLRHVRIHSGAKPYRCPYCDYACNNQENIRKHILKTKKHVGKKMYPCQFCDFSCNNFKEYQEHSLSKHSEWYARGHKDVAVGLYAQESRRKAEKLQQETSEEYSSSPSEEKCGTPDNNELQRSILGISKGFENCMEMSSCEIDVPTVQNQNNLHLNDESTSQTATESSELGTIVYLESDLDCVEVAIGSDCIGEVKTMQDSGPASCDVTTKRFLIFVQ